MIETTDLLPGVTVRCIADHRFKQGVLTIQFLRPMIREETALNALLPAVLLRGTQKDRDMRAIIARLDDLYGAGISALVRRVGDYQTTGFSCHFIEDRFALPGDRVLEPLMAFVGELLFQPMTDGDGFLADVVQSEKENLIAAIESERNDKGAYAAGKLLRIMCKGDSFGIPRLGTAEQVESIDAAGLYAHYRRLLCSPVEVFYVGSVPAETVTENLQKILSPLQIDRITLPNQTPFHDVGGDHETEEMEIAQCKLAMGFVTEITNRSADFAAMQVMNTLFGGGMNGKLFMNIREKMSLCYSIGSGYYGAKGILTVNAGIDADKEPLVRQEILRQLADCRENRFTDSELHCAREQVLSGLRMVCDSPGAMEGFFSTGAIGGFPLTLEQYRDAVQKVTREDVCRVAGSLRLHSSFVLKGVTP